MAGIQAATELMQCLITPAIVSLEPRSSQLMEKENLLFDFVSFFFFLPSGH